MAPRRQDVPIGCRVSSQFTRCLALAMIVSVSRDSKYPFREKPYCPDHELTTRVLYPRELLQRKNPTRTQVSAEYGASSLGLETPHTAAGSLHVPALPCGQDVEGVQRCGFDREVPQSVKRRYSWRSKRDSGGWTQRLPYETRHTWPRESGTYKYLLSSNGTTSWGAGSTKQLVNSQLSKACSNGKLKQPVT